MKRIIDITVGATKTQQAGLRSHSRLPIRAHLNYQACDDSHFHGHFGYTAGLKTRPYDARIQSL